MYLQYLLLNVIPYENLVSFWINYILYTLFIFQEGGGAFRFIPFVFLLNEFVDREGSQDITNTVLQECENLELEFVNI
jgi:hypothetical protein